MKVKIALNSWDNSQISDMVEILEDKREIFALLLQFTAKRQPMCSSGQSSLLQIQRSGFGS
jgi:hypothetical protein